MLEQPEELAKRNQTLVLESDLLKLLQENLDKNAEVLTLARQIKSHMHWQVVWSFIRLFIVVIPIILGLIYLPPLVKDFLATYSFLLPY